jgi:tetratricopeptide (TPR) repeat protein
VIARVWLGQFLLGNSQLHRGAAQLADALAIVDAWPESANRDAFAQKVVTELLGACVRLGRLDEAQALAARAADLDVASMQNHSFAARFRIHRAALAIERGEFDAARQDLDAAGASIERDALGGHVVNVKGYGPVRVRLHADLGDGAGAIDTLRAWLASSGRVEPLADDDCIGLHAAALAQLAQGDARGATQTCERGLAALQRHAYRWSVVDSEANLLGVLGQARLAEGDGFAAVDALRRSVALLRDLVDADCSPTLARVLVACASALLAIGDRAASAEMLAGARLIHERHIRLGPQHRAPLQCVELALAKAS